MTSKDKKFPRIMGVHASYSTHKKRPSNDMVLVKERHLLPSGEVKTKLRYFENFQRDFYVTKPRYRNHKSKKEWEKINHCNRIKTNQAGLVPAIAKALKIRKQSPRVMARNPFLYGSDVHVTTIILHKYIETYGDAVLMPTVGVMDYEWDVDDQSPTIGTYMFENDVYITVRKDKITNCGYTVEKFIKLLHEGFEEHVIPAVNEFYERKDDAGNLINDKVERIHPKLHVEVVDLDLDVIRKLFKHTHTTMPDYLMFWNGISDLTTIENTCKEYMVDMSDFMNDPSVPQEYRHTKVVKGPTETIDANGNPKPKKPSEQWHVLENMASWQFIDGMCCYHTNRAHKPDLPSYSFEYVMGLELAMKKMRLVEELNHLAESDMKEWHKQMSNTRILEYALYATMDVIEPMILESKSFEIRAQAYSNITYHPLTDFKKNPRKLCNAQHFSFLEKGSVVGSTSDQMREALDDLVYPSSDWIITLNSSYHDQLETPALSDSPINTLYIPANDDGDLTSSYPSNQRLLNISKTTTVTELISVKGIPDEIMREVGLNVASCGDNAIDFCHRIFGLPHLQDIVVMWNEQKEK